MNIFPVQSHFSAAETGHLTLLIGQINSWDRIQIGLREIHPVAVAVTAAA